MEMSMSKPFFIKSYNNHKKGPRSCIDIWVQPQSRCFIPRATKKEQVFLFDFYIRRAFSPSSILPEKRGEKPWKALTAFSAGKGRL